MSALQTGCILHSDEHKLVDDLQSKLKIKKNNLSAQLLWTRVQTQT